MKFCTAKTKVLGLSVREDFMILAYLILTQYHVWRTDRRTDGHAATTVVVCCAITWHLYRYTSIFCRILQNTILSLVIWMVLYHLGFLFCPSVGVVLIFLFPVFSSSHQVPFAVKYGRQSCAILPVRPPVELIYVTNLSAWLCSIWQFHIVKVCYCYCIMYTLYVWMYDKRCGYERWSCKLALSVTTSNARVIPSQIIMICFIILFDCQTIRSGVFFVFVSSF